MVNLNKKVTIEELKMKFPKFVEVAPYGWCVLVPGDEFNPDWEADLDEEGHLCHEVTFKDKPVVLVEMRKKDEPIPTSGPQKQSPETTLKTRSFKDWSVEEDKVLVDKWKEDKLSISGITKQCFPTRSTRSVAMHVWDLQQKGIIEKKVKGRRPKASKNNPQAKQKGRARAKVPSIISIEDPAVGLLKEILDCLRGFEPVTFSFECHCRKCGDNRSVHEEDEVWRVCPRCGEPLIIWNVQPLEASQ